jgi:hypothetical protein
LGLCLPAGAVTGLVLQALMGGPSGPGAGYEVLLIMGSIGVAFVVHALPLVLLDHLLRGRYRPLTWTLAAAAPSTAGILLLWQLTGQMDWEPAMMPALAAGGGLVLGIMAGDRRRSVWLSPLGGVLFGALAGFALLAVAEFARGFQAHSTSFEDFAVALSSGAVVIGMFGLATGLGLHLERRLAREGP